MNRLVSGLVAVARLTLSLSLLISVNAFALSSPTWSKQLSENLKTQTLQNTFCAQSAGSQTKAACDTFAKNKANLNFKLTSINIAGPLLILADGKRTLEIRRTTNSTQFEINHKIIDIGNLRSYEALQSAIRKSIPKVAKNSLWINSAFAEEDLSNSERMAIAAHLILTSTSDTEICSAAHDFANSCQKNIDDSPSLTLFSVFIDKLKNGKPLTTDNKRMLSAILQDFKVELFKMRNMTVGFDKKESALQRCSSITPSKERSSVNDVIECAQSLEDGIKNLAAIPDIVEQVDKATYSNAMKIQQVASEFSGHSSTSNSSDNKKTDAVK